MKLFLIKAIKCSVHFTHPDTTTWYEAHSVVPVSVNYLFRSSAAYWVRCTLAHQILSSLHRPSKLHNGYKNFYNHNRKEKLQKAVYFLNGIAKSFIENLTEDNV